MNIISQLIIKFTSKLIGMDSFGNKYYEEKNNSNKKRYVIFNGKVEASKIPPMWHAWLHHLAKKPPLKRKKVYDWQKTHMPNLTGTIFAKKPKGSVFESGKRQKSYADYETWIPRKK